MVKLVGVRVLRGPDWDDGDQDGGEGHLGTITQLLSNHKVSVVWDNGNERTYRAGTDGKFDLRIFDTAQAGVQHPNHTCAECGDVNFYGMMWTCNECSGVDLCTLCYYNDKHDLRHQFLRLDVSGDVGQLMKKRKASIKIRSAGMFPGAKVKRGKDWKWDDQDGGQSSEGVVDGFENVAPDSSRNILRVEWPNGASNCYRVGFTGHMDILCVEEEPGLFYYRDHLPVADTTRFQQTPIKTEKSTPESSTASCNSSIFLSDVQERRETTDKYSEKTSSDKQSQSVATTGSLSGESTKEFKDIYTISSVAHTTASPDLRENDDFKNLYRVLRRAMGSESHSESALLFHAIHQGNDEVVRAMCEADKSLIKRLHQDTTPLMLACLEDQRRVVDILLEMGADVNHYVDNKTPLDACLQGRNEHLVKLLLERGADPFKVDWRNNRTYIHVATGFDLPGAIRTLAEVGVDVNAKDEDQDTALHLAISQNKMKAMEALTSLESIDFKVQNKRHFEVLHHACFNGSVRAVELILARDKSRVDVYFCEQSTPLHIATFIDHFECVRLLVIEGGATIDMPHLPQLHTPLHLACKYAKFFTAEALLELGADVNVQDAQRGTPLHLTMGCRVISNFKSEEGEHENQIRVGIACMLISKGAYCDAKDEDGRTPLVYGCSSITEAVKKFVASNPHLVKLTTGIASEMTTGTASVFQKKENYDVTEALKGMGLPCGVCFALKSDVTLQPCQHKCVCSKCSEKVTQCPLCDALVEDKDVTGEDDQNIDVERFFKDIGIL